MEDDQARRMMESFDTAIDNIIRELERLTSGNVGHQAPRIACGARAWKKVLRDSMERTIAKNKDEVKIEPPE